ncbi:FAD-dependent monooxygenase [Streptosporangium sp. OZ121]|uniref:FAD-dependent monooxygenase n=1 Tax=Streptosporangium sp. OZ121 TaxID=3444183 RepID=UPI003F7AF155
MTADVIVAGGGPVGLMLACELRLSGAHPVVLERLPEPGDVPKANGLVGQIVPMLDYRGLLERFAAGAPFAGPTPFFQFGAIPLDLRRLGVSPLHLLPIQQPRLERLLGERARELGVEIRRGHELTALEQDGDGVTARVHGPGGGYRLRGHYLVGCDGAHSLVREQAGIPFPGTTGHEVARFGDVVLPTSVVVPGTGELEVPGAGRVRPGFTRTATGVFVHASFRPGVHRIAVIEWADPPPGLTVQGGNGGDGGNGQGGDGGGDGQGGGSGRGGPISLDELRQGVRRVLGTDLPVDRPVWLSKVGANSRHAERYRSGRVLLAGDAAHAIAAFGGPSLNVGLLDAVNLGWKLAARVRGWAPPGLLDTYHDERHPVAARVLMHTQAQSALMAPGGGVTALRELFGMMLEHEEPLRRLGRMLQGSDVRYPVDPAGSPHPLLGSFVPDLPLTIGEDATPMTKPSRAARGAGPSHATRVAELLHAARPVLLDLADRHDVRDRVSAWGNRVDVVTARCPDPPADALLIRPDAHVAWAVATGEPLGEDLDHALTRWIGTGTTN